MWDERLAEVCRRHPDLVAVYESSRGRLGLLLRQTLVPLARALERLVPRREAAAWRRWIDHVCADLARTLGRPPQLRTQAWARWLFFIPYSVPAPRRMPRRSPRLPAATWTAKPWREKMNV